MKRFALPSLVAALLVATAAAFAYAERLKLTPSPILGTRVDKLFAPTCACGTGSARIAFRLRRHDRVTVTIIDRHGTVVRTITRGRPEHSGLVVVRWDGRDDSGAVVPDGVYRPRVKLALNRRTILLPNPIRTDTTRPTIRLRVLRPRLFSPDGDGRSDYVVVGYRVDEPAHVALYVDGVRRVLKKGSRRDGTIQWFGRVDGLPMATGVHRLSLLARDVAGNVSLQTPPRPVVLRYISLGRTRIVTAPRQRFALLVSADASHIEWRLGGRLGSATPGTVHLRAPARPGRYTLMFLEHGHTVRAAVIVRRTT